MTQTVNSPVPNLGRNGWLSEAWQLFNQQRDTWVAGALLVLVLSIVSYVAILFISFIPLGILTRAYWVRFPYGASHEPIWMPIVYFIAQVTNHFVTSFLSAGVIGTAISAVRRHKISVSQLFSGKRRTVALFIYTLPLSLAFYAVYSTADHYMRAHFASFGWWYYGNIALIYAVFGFIGIFLVPSEAQIIEGMSVVEAWKLTFKASRENFRRLASFAIKVELLQTGGLLTCGLGFLALLPVLTICSVLISRDTTQFPGAPDTITYPVEEPVLGVWPPPPS